ncbi:MAG: outer membrane protein assembly factor BamD [Limnohabitans sp.]
MQRIGLSSVPAALCLAALVLLSGCSSSPKDVTQGWSVERLYKEARDEVSAGAWDKAIQLLDKLEGRAAGTVLAQQAQVEKAWAQYKNSDKVQAVATLDRFMRLHPTSPAMDYALYLKGLVNFNDNLGLFSALINQDLSERDQRAAKESYESFLELSRRFPESKYTPDARQRMTYIVNALAGYEVHVARYYARRGAHVAAINRAQQVLAEYPGVPASEEALAILVYAYDALGMAQLRDDAKRVMEKNFPNSSFLKNPLTGRVSKPWWQVW